ncbi:gamma-Glu-gamma-aminobutyraldehyde dehydrogenase, NAD(P)H-dependent [Mesorhizobium plurifarium]|uniref:Gamma-Glu-gamma-aminobutyraldehyde dehydrogenase, NAD(P)H-dependent n=1 Tax=Mesorhizobium plurifarium TaxID=69974 RepID=A0A0K2VTJ1_MESPL|nr:gamma-Glu-gamma-aminobutyraldehyde dehydrogenase, NAD(P)H-dependent [Mesorhizobium plurifarium]
MSNFTRNDALTIAAALKLPSRPFIAGDYRQTVGGRTFKSVNPATGEVLAEIAACGPSDVDAAVAAAKAAFDSGVWSQKHPSERKAVLVRFAQLINENLQELAVLESLDSGKPITDCLTVDVPFTAATIAWHAEAQDKLFSRVAPTDNNALGLIVREPLGVVGLVLPWNFPMLMAGWKLGPALATGNSVVLKPSQMTTLSALRLAELAIEAGLPAGVLNVVTGSGSVGEALGLHRDVRIISFTGSTEVGRKFLDYSQRSNLKRIVLELGGKNPAVVLADAPSLDFVAEQQAFSILTNMGQNCASNSRLIVHKAVKDELFEKIVAVCRNWKLGDPLEPTTQLGPVVGEGHCNNIKKYLEKGRADGARLACGGNQVDRPGYFIEATVFDRVTPEMTIYREEIFGPVLTIVEARDDEHAIELANDTEYGLTASLYTTDLGKAHHLARKINAGTVSVNCYSEGDFSTPFGGFKQSGFGGRDNGLEAHDQYTEVKTVWMNLAAPARI